MSARSSEFSDEQKKIYWILSYMQTGTARTWREFIISQMFRQTIFFGTADDFLLEIQRKFGDTDKRTTMSLKIRTMVQGEKTADEHVQEFEKAALEADYEGYPLVVEFKRSLNPALRRRVSELRPAPVTIDQWYNEAITIDRQWRVAKAEEAFYGKVNSSATKKVQTPATGSSSSGPRQNYQGQGQNRSYQAQGSQGSQPRQNYQAAGQKDPNAMDVDRAKRPPLKCFKCNGMGHMARDCRSQLNIRAMTYDEMADYFGQQEAARKDREAIKEKEKKDFPAATQ
jgi:hypothetical protein